MKTKLWIAAVAAVGLVVPGAAQAVSAEPTDSDDRSLAKIARARAKTAGSAQAKTQAKNGSNDSSCDLNIGNTVNTRPGAGPKEIIVVVQGDVINANNKCK
jgi:hypothetical protein